MRVVGFECINMGVIGLQVVLQMVQDKITEEQMYIEEKRGQRTEEFCIRDQQEEIKGLPEIKKDPSLRREESQERVLPGNQGKMVFKERILDGQMLLRERDEVNEVTILIWQLFGPW